MADEDSQTIERSEEVTEAIVPGLNIFESAHKQIALEKSRYNTYSPLTSTDRDAPLEFIIYSDNEYIDLHSTLLYVSSKITAANGDALKKVTGDNDDTVPDASIVFPVNYIHAARFKSIEVYVNGTKISESDSLYPLRAYMETLLGTDKQMQESELTSALWFKDTALADPVHFDYHDKDHLVAAEWTGNLGARARYEMIKFSREFETIGPIHNEFFNQGKYLAPGIEVKIRLNRSELKFCLMSKVPDAVYTMPIMKAKLLVRQYEATDDLRSAHEVMLANPTLNKNLVYPVQRVAMKFFTLGPQRSDLSENSLYKGKKLPRRVIVGFVESAALNGDYHKSPFNFQHFKVKSITLRKNGISVGIPITMTFKDEEPGQYQLGYLGLLQSLGKLRSGASINISYLEYSKGYALYGFDLSVTNAQDCDDLDTGGGALSLEVSLDGPTTVSVTTVCYLEFDSEIQLRGQDRQVYYPK